MSEQRTLRLKIRMHRKGLFEAGDKREESWGLCFERR